MTQGDIKSNCLQCVNKSYCFRQLKTKELDFINSERVELSYKKGEIISKQGAFVTQILFVKKGLTKVYKEIDNNNNLIFNIFPAGNLIGLPTLFNKNLMQFTVAAVEDTVICAINKDAFEKLILENGKFATAIITTLNRCFLFNFDKLVSLTQKQLNGRLAEILIFLADKIYKSDHFKLTLTRKDLSEITGMSVMSIIRVIKEFKNDGLIEDKNGKIKLLNKEILHKISLLG